MKDNEVIKWLKKYFNDSKINEQKIKSLLHFSLLWNYFENNYFNNSKRLNQENLYVLATISVENVNEEMLDSVFNHFRDRYLDSCAKFDSLKLSETNCSYLDNRSAKEYCNLIINKTSPCKLEKLSIIFFIMHRFRNNFFHGQKKTETLNLYKKEFNEINKFLMSYFDETGKDNSINKLRFDS